MEGKKNAKRSQHELKRLVEEACAAELNLPRPGLWLCVDRVEVVGRPPERVRAWATLHFLPEGSPFCCGEPTCQLGHFGSEKRDAIGDRMRRAMGLRHELAFEFADIHAHYSPGVLFKCNYFIDEPLDAEYLRREGTEGLLKVRECLRKWHPFGVLCRENRDEYDGYAAAIVRLLDGGIMEDALFSHMKWIVKENMGSISCDEAKTMEIARELVEFWKKRKGELSEPPENQPGR